MRRIKHWQDPVNALLGAWLIVSPWALGFQGVIVAVTSTMAIGALLIASSLGAMSVPQAWEEGLDAVLGAALMITSGVGYLGQKRFLGRTLGNTYAILSILNNVLSLATLHQGFGIGTLIGLIYPVLTLILLNTTFKDDLVN